MVYSFFTPLSIEETSHAIQAAIRAINGKVRVYPDGRIVGKWRSPRNLKKKFTFYIGDGIVRAVMGKHNMEIIIMRFKLGGFHIIWDHFIKNLIKMNPGIDFGVTPGNVEIVAAEFVGNGTQQILVSTTYHSPSIIGAIVGGELWGPAGAMIGSSYGTSRTTTTMKTQFSNTVLTRVRYSNGLLAEGHLSINSPTYHELLVKYKRFSGK